jgi:predicted DNA-binding antitoxin AbrB/MazE fold protein
MSLFAKSKPTKRVDLPDGAWVEIQNLPKGIKESFKSELADLFKGVDIKKGEDGEDEPDRKTLPDSFVQKIAEVNYRKLEKAIKSWSAEGVPVTIENIKELDEEIFDQILTAVNKMNELNDTERKNS